MPGAAAVPTPGKKGKKVKQQPQEKPAGKTAVEKPGLPPLTVGTSAPVPGTEPPPTPSPQQADALFAFPPVLAAAAV